MNMWVEGSLKAGVIVDAIRNWRCRDDGEIREAAKQERIELVSVPDPSTTATCFKFRPLNALI